ALNALVRRKAVLAIEGLASTPNRQAVSRLPRLDDTTITYFLAVLHLVPPLRILRRIVCSFCGVAGTRAYLIHRPLQGSPDPRYYRLARPRSWQPRPAARDPC